MLVRKKKVERMKITDMHITPIAISDPPLLNAAGLHAPYALRIIVELISDDGISGWSEIPGGERNRYALEQVRDIVIGKDPFQINAILAKMKQFITEDDRGNAPWDQRQWVHAQSAIEVACFDMMGKAVNRPIVDLLGGKCRDRVPFAAYLFYKHKGAGGELEFNTDKSATGWAAARQNAALDAEGIVVQAKAMIDHFGFQSIKLKGGVFEPSIEVKSIMALRKAFGKEIPLRIDPNGIWTVETAIKWGKKLEGVLEYYEDPVRGQESMATVGKTVNIPMATNMCTTSFDDLPASVQHHSEDIILSDHHFWGGFRSSLELARFCATFERGLSMHSNSHLGLSLAAMTHMAAAVPNLDYACDTHYPWQYEEIVANPLQFEDGAIAVPSGAGLGVEVDRDAIQRLHEQYLACGLEERNDEVEMQKVKPDWTFKDVRW
jgi:glucarate dehydratase